MANRIERPVFYEGQILGASDLEAVGDYSRNQQARHNRYLHTWGIAKGLELDSKDKKTDDGQDYKEITLMPGVAIDGTGREIVVPDAERLSETQFLQLNIIATDAADPKGEAWYPVFLIGRDEDAPQPAFATGACNNSQPTRKIESYEVTFGRPGDAQDLDEQTAPAVSDGPQDANWKVLLGFVQWNKTAKKFKNVELNPEGISPHYAGVQADEVIARAGTLTLRSRPANKGGAPVVVITEAGGGELHFGLQDAEGKITDPPVFKVNAKGDITAAGKISGAVAPGSVQLQSGVVTDGVVLPLPPGITEEQVANDQVALHINLTPRIPGGAPPTNPPNATDWVAVPLECKLDGASRRVLCRFQWFRLSAPGTNQVLPGACNYTIMASVPAATGS